MTNQIMVTLNQVKSTEPSEELWQKLLGLKGNTEADYDKPFPLSEILAVGSLNDTIKCFYCLPEHRKVFVEFALFCAKSANMYTCNTQVHSCIAKTKAYIEGNVSSEEVVTAADEVNIEHNSTCEGSTAAVQVARYVLRSLQDPEAPVYPTAIAYAANVASHVAYSARRYVPDAHAYGTPTFVYVTLDAHTARSREVQKQADYLRILLDGEEYRKPEVHRPWLCAFLTKLFKKAKKRQRWKI